MKSKKIPGNLAEALKVKPEQMAALLLLGYSYYESGRYPEARDMLEGILLLDTANPYPHAMLGAIHQREENFEAAVSCYSKALELHDRDIHSLTNRGECYLNLSKFKEAADDFTAAMTLDPERKHPAANRARFLAALTLEALALADEQGLDAVRDAKRRIDAQLAL